MNDLLEKVFTFAILLIGGSILILVVTCIIQWCWNTSISYLFTLPQMNYKQAVAFVCFVILCSGKYPTLKWE